MDTPLSPNDDTQEFLFTEQWQENLERLYERYLFEKDWEEAEERYDTYLRSRGVQPEHWDKDCDASIDWNVLRSKRSLLSYGIRSVMRNRIVAVMGSIGIALSLSIPFGGNGENTKEAQLNAEKKMESEKKYIDLPGEPKNLWRQEWSQVPGFAPDIDPLSRRDVMRALLSENAPADED